MIGITWPKQKFNNDYLIDQWWIVTLVNMTSFPNGGSSISDIRPQCV